MGNTHGIPDTASELQAVCADVLPAVILSVSWPTVPVPPSLTFAAFATRGYVRDGANLPYVEQAAAPLTLSGADGNFWVALHRNTSSPVTLWTRQAGTHYLWRSNATLPADPAGALVFAAITVAGGVITVVTPIAGVSGNPPAWRTHLGLGTIATQTADAVAITGGAITGPVLLNTSANAYIDGNTFAVDATNNRVGIGIDNPSLGLDVNTAAYFRAQTGFGASPYGNSRVAIEHQRSTEYGLVMKANDGDSGNVTVLFLNVAGATVGSINATAAGTAFNTTSDPRLKDEVADLPNPLQVIAGLRPIAFRWKRNQALGRGFLANEVQALVPEAVTGEPDAVDAAGNIVPQQIDYSKLVPWLVGAVKTLITLNTARVNQIQALAARVAALEAAG